VPLTDSLQTDVTVQPITSISEPLNVKPVPLDVVVVNMMSTNVPVVLASEKVSHLVTVQEDIMKNSHIVYHVITNVLLVKENMITVLLVHLIPSETNKTINVHVTKDSTMTELQFVNLVLLDVNLVLDPQATVLNVSPKETYQIVDVHLNNILLSSMVL
jgi:hypothetical protein